MITNLRFVPPEWRDEALAAEARAHQAGAPEELEYVGIGMYGIVFCDKADRAWKVFRTTSNPSEKQLLFLRDELAEEYEWLRDAAGSAAAPHVARVYAMHPEEIVLERECVPGNPDFGKTSELHKLHLEIEKIMEPLGWTAPEFKESSYIYDERTGKPRLVDISMAQRIGMTLAHFVEEVLEGRKTHYSWHDLGFFIVRELPYKTIPEYVARLLLTDLVALDPELKKSFQLPPGIGSALPI